MVCSYSFVLFPLSQSNQINERSQHILNTVVPLLCLGRTSPHSTACYSISWIEWRQSEIPLTSVYLDINMCFYCLLPIQWQPYIITWYYPVDTDYSVEFHTTPSIFTFVPYRHSGVDDLEPQQKKWTAWRTLNCAIQHSKNFSNF